MLRRLLISVLAMAAVHALPAAAAVSGTIKFADVNCGSFPAMCFVGGGATFYTDERSRSVGNQSFGSVQLGFVEIDLGAGTLKGRQSAEDFGVDVNPITTVVRADLGQPLLKVVALPGAPVGGTVQLTLGARLHGDFLTDDLLGSQSFMENRFNAYMGFRGKGASVASQEIYYQYLWFRASGSEDFEHSALPTAIGCPGNSPTCKSEVMVPEPAFLHQYRNGFTDVDLQIVRPVAPGEEFHLDFFIEAKATANNLGAFGAWDNTARLGVTLPAGYVLTHALTGEALAWNLSPVPEPSQAALFAAGLVLVVGFGQRARGRRTASKGVS